MAHTPGPWETDGDQVYAADDLNDGYLVARTFGSDLIDNGNLIAAAPDLLEALAWFINDIDGTHTVMVDFDANVERARAALARAQSPAPLQQGVG
jgi:hypothetical protein